MYNINDVVMYGTSGLCKVCSIETLDLTGIELEYYILKHMQNDSNVFYVPTNNQAALSKMHPVCSRDEVDTLIRQMNDEKPLWIENDTKRRECYNSILKSGDKHDIIKLIKALYLRRKELSESGKKLRSTDETFLSVAENMLYDEFAYALHIDRSEVVGYIQKHIA